jgi:hypothetical protein
MSQSKILLEYARLAVTHVLSGRTADGLRPLDVHVSFPRDSERYHVPALVIARILRGLERRLDGDELTALTVKLLTHVGRDKRGPFHACWCVDIQAVQSALNSRPHILTSRASIAAMVRAAGQDEAYAIKLAAAAAIPPRRVIATFGDYTLAEITDPSHLREDGLAVGHCAGVQYDHPYLNALVPQPTGRQRLFALTYWRHIAFGNLRIFSLLEDGRPRATIGYSIHRQAVTELAIVGKFTATSAPFVPPLCRALVELGKQVRIRAIQQLPASPNDGEAISIDGSFIPLRPENAHRLLNGQINLSVQTTSAELTACASNPFLVLDITDVPSRVLDALMFTAGSLRSAARHVRLNSLTSIDGGLYCRRPEMVEMRALQTIGASQICQGARAVRQDHLRRIEGNNGCDRVGRIYQPQLTFVGGRNQCSECDEVIQPRLVHAMPEPEAPPAPGWQHMLVRTMSRAMMRTR